MESGLSTRFESFFLNSESEEDIQNIKKLVEAECCAATNDPSRLDDLADNYFQDAERAMLKGFEGIAKVYVWAGRWVMCLERTRYQNLKPVVNRRSSKNPFFPHLESNGDFSWFHTK